MPEDVKTLKKYFEYLKAERSYWDNGVWKDTIDNLLPEWEDLSRTHLKGQRKATKIFDSSPRDYHSIFSDGMHGNMINPMTVWFEQRLPSAFQFLEDDPNVRQWLQDVSEQLYYEFAISNYYSQMRRFFRAGGGIGTANLYLDEDKTEQKLVFSNLHPRESYLAENKHGVVDVCFRLFRPTARVMKQEFGEENLSPAVKQALKTNPFREFDIVHGVYPNTEFDSNKLGNRYKRYSSKWFEYNSRSDGKRVFLRESGFRVFPFHPWRYLRGENGPYGDSPATLALPEIMGLQVIGKSLLGAGERSVNPSWQVPAEMKGKVRNQPGGMNYYGPDYNRRIYPTTSGINFPIGVDREDRKDAILRRHFHVDFFLMLQNSERTMTAREVAEKMGEKATILSAGVGDLTNVLDGQIDHVYEISKDAGRMPTPPDILIDFMGGMRIPIEYTGPLPMAQKRIFQTRGITDSLSIAEPFYAAFPETADLIDKDKTLVEILKAHGFPQSLIQPTNIVQEVRQGRAEAQSQEAQKIDIERLSDVIKNLAMAHKQSSGQFNQQIRQILGAAQPGAIA